MDFSKIESLKKLAKKDTITETATNSEDLEIIKLAFISLVCAILFLIHYIHYMDIQYTRTVIVRLFQFFLSFFILFNIAIYLGYDMNDIIFRFIFIMSIPYIYYIFQKLFNFTRKISFKTVKGRIYLVSSFLFIVAMFLILRQYTLF